MSGSSALSQLPKDHPLFQEDPAPLSKDKKSPSDKKTDDVAVKVSDGKAVPLGSAEVETKKSTRQKGSAFQNMIHHMRYSHNSFVSQFQSVCTKYGKGKPVPGSTDAKKGDDAEDGEHQDGKTGDNSQSEKKPSTKRSLKSKAVSLTFVDGFERPSKKRRTDKAQRSTELPSELPYNHAQGGGEDAPHFHPGVRGGAPPRTGTASVSPHVSPYHPQYHVNRDGKSGTGFPLATASPSHLAPVDPSSHGVRGAYSRTSTEYLPPQGSPLVGNHASPYHPPPGQPGPPQASPYHGPGQQAPPQASPYHPPGQPGAPHASPYHPPGQPPPPQASPYHLPGQQVPPQASPYHGPSQPGPPQASPYHPPLGLAYPSPQYSTSHVSGYDGTTSTGSGIYRSQPSPHVASPYGASPYHNKAPYATGTTPHQAGATHSPYVPPPPPSAMPSPRYSPATANPAPHHRAPGPPQTAGSMMTSAPPQSHMDPPPRPAAPNGAAPQYHHASQPPGVPHQPGGGPPVAMPGPPPGPPGPPPGPPPPRPNGNEGYGHPR